MDSDNQGYSVEEVQSTPINKEAKLKIKAATKKIEEISSNKHIDELNLKVDYLSNKILRIKITDANKARYEVPAQKYFNIPKASPSSALQYEVELNKGNNFNLIVTRKSDKTKL